MGENSKLEVEVKARPLASVISLLPWQWEVGCRQCCLGDVREFTGCITVVCWSTFTITALTFCGARKKLWFLTRILIDKAEYLRGSLCDSSDPCTNSKCDYAIANKKRFSVQQTWIWISSTGISLCDSVFPVCAVGTRFLLWEYSLIPGLRVCVRSPTF